MPDLPSSSSNAAGTGGETPSRPPRVDVVYITGAHRSGATIVGALLGAAPGAFFEGEAYRFPRPIFWQAAPGRECSCGSPAERCPFWSEIRTELEHPAPLLEELEKGQRRYESWAAFPARVGAALRRNPELDNHVRRMTEFLRVVATRAEARVVVESSYSAMRGSLYRHADLGGGRVRFLHLVRDGRSFLASEHFATSDPEAPPPWLQSSPAIVARWVVFNVAATLLRVRDPGSYLRVRYEDILLRPAETLAQIGAFLDLDLSDVVRSVAMGQAIPMRHIAAGNRVRLLGHFTLRRDLAAPPRLPPSTSILFWVFGGWLAILLGYPLKLRHAEGGRP